MLQDSSLPATMGLLSKNAWQRGHQTGSPWKGQDLFVLHMGTVTKYIV